MPGIANTPMFDSTERARIVLASASARRRDLLGSLGFDYYLYCPAYEEEPPEIGEKPNLYAARMAAAKAAEAHAEACDYPRVIIAADTVVYLNGDILGKPKTTTSAFAMLAALNGREHQVFTAVHFIFPNYQVAAFSEMSRVYFAKWHFATLEAYLASTDALDRAGAYGIQNNGAFLIERIEGSYTNVLGLPLARITRILLEKRFIRPKSVYFS